MKLLKVKFEIKAKLQVAVMIPPTAAWGSQRWTVLCLKHGPSEWDLPGQEAQARPWLPALASNSKI